MRKHWHGEKDWRIVPNEGVIGPNGHRNLSRRTHQRLKMKGGSSALGRRRLAKWRLVANQLISRHSPTHREGPFMADGLLPYAVGGSRPVAACRAAVVPGLVSKRNGHWVPSIEDKSSALASRVGFSTQRVARVPFLPGVVLIPAKQTSTCTRIRTRHTLESRHRFLCPSSCCSHL